MAASETNIYVNDAWAALSANGNAAGYVAVTDASAFYPGMIAWLTSDTLASVKCRIMKVDASNHIYLSPVLDNGKGPNYALKDWSGFTTADHASISMEGGIATLASPSSINKKNLIP